MDQHGIPLAGRPSAANSHDATQLLPLVEAMPSIIGLRSKPGRPRKRPAKLHADQGDDYSHLRRALRAWLLTVHPLSVRSERRADLLPGLLDLACARS